jgi:SAM-dependent methyltransferase
MNKMDCNCLVGHWPFRKAPGVRNRSGILHLFGDLNRFIEILYTLLKSDGKLVLSDFHPFRKVNSIGSLAMSVPQTNGNYFDSSYHNAEVAFRSFFPPEEQALFPDVFIGFIH